MKERQEGEGRPRQELITESHTYRKEPDGYRQERTANTALASLVREQRGWSGRSHEKLVKGFRDFVQRQQEILWRDWGENFSPLQIIRTELGLYKDLADRKTQAFVTPIAVAWDVLAYEHYEPGSRAESGAGLGLAMHCKMHKESVIRLSEPQIEIIDALTEATGIPYQKGQAEIEIPEKLRNFFNWIHSEERLQRVAQARSKTNRR